MITGRGIEGRTITKVMGGVGKKQGKVTEKINCANSKNNHGLKFEKKNNVQLTVILACLIGLQLSKHIPYFESLDIQDLFRPQ